MTEGVSFCTLGRELPTVKANRLTRSPISSESRKDTLLALAQVEEASSSIRQARPMCGRSADPDPG